MTKKLALALLATLALSGCTGPKGTDEMVSDTVSDTQILKEAESAANDLIRNASDCTAVTASFPDVMAKLDEVEGRIQTAAGRTTISTLKKQVQNVGEACGAR
jgi:hypothetical protein